MVPGSSLVDLARLLAARRLLRRRTVLRHIAANQSFARNGARDGKVDQLRRAALNAMSGCDHTQLIEVAHEAGWAVAERAYPGARWLLDRHRSDGDFCVLLSAAPQELVDAVAAALGVHRAVGTRAAVRAGRLTGELDGPFCYGEGKLTRLASEVGPIDFSTASAYADSASDLPLLKACGHPVAINPDRRLRRHADAAGWPVLRFD